MLFYRLGRLYNSLKVKVCFWNEIKTTMYIMLQIQLKCTYGFIHLYTLMFYTPNV